MKHPVALRIEEANQMRTRYILSHYTKFVAQRPENLDVKVSRVVFEILAFHLQDKESFDDNDVFIIERCGSLLAPAIFSALEEIRAFPPDVVRKIYPVLYNQYFNPEGVATDLWQLRTRLEKEGICVQKEELSALLCQGEKIMATINEFCEGITGWLSGLPG